MFRKTVSGVLTCFLLLVTGAAHAVVPLFPIGLDPVTFQGNTYQVFIDPGTDWDSADTAAQNAVFQGTNGHLATITSAAEDQFIDSLRRVALSQYSVAPEFWIGGFQDLEDFFCFEEEEEEEGAPLEDPTCGWTWVNGEGSIPGVNGDPSGYSNWLSGEPNDLGDESHIGVGLGDQFGWNDEGSLGNIGGYIVEYEGGITDEPAGTVDANDCQGDACNPSGAQVVLLPDTVILQGNDKLTQLVEAIFIDPRVNPATGLCDDRRPLDVYAELDPDGNFDPVGGPSLDGTLILPEFLCGSNNFAVIRSDASFEVLQNVIRTEQFPETVFPQFYDCDDPADVRDLQERGVFVWSPDETEMPTREGRALELTNGCGSSKGAHRELSYFVLNLHIDCGIPFGTNDAAVLQCFIDLTNDKFASLDQSLKNAKTKLMSPKYGNLRSQFVSAWDAYQNGNYVKASQRLGRFISRVDNGSFDVSDGFNYEGDLLMRAENIKFIIDEKINP